VFPALVATPLRALDFTPQETWRQLEGMRIPVLMFSDPTGKIRYQPPGDWKFSGGGATLSLYPPSANGAFMKMLVLGHAPGLPQITTLPSADLVKWSQNYIASDAQEVKLQEENPSPFMLSGRPSREFIFEYKSSGQRFQTSVAVLDWDEHEHLAVVITALAGDFKAVHNTGISSLFSWNLRKTTLARPSPATSAGGPSATAFAPGPTPIPATSK
jgi:hypothetical protein